MVPQQQLTVPQVVALWLGDFDSFEDFDAYIGQHFERDFGFRLNDRAMPELSAPSGELTPIKDLLTGFSFDRDWIAGAIDACEAQKIREAKAAAIFHHLRYRQELCRNPNAPLRFVANIPWNAERKG